MQSRFMNVYYGVDRLPYKDENREVHYPNASGNIITGENNTTKIYFYVGLIGGSQRQWIANIKKPDGTLSYQLCSNGQSVGSDYRVELDIASLYADQVGDVYIGLQGYSGETVIVEDEGTYEISGNPIVLATGTIKIKVNYAPSVLPKGETLSPTAEQLILSAFSGKLDITSGILIVDTLPLDTTDYQDKQVLFDKETSKFYELVDGEWNEIGIAGEGSVSSVNGKVGTVVLTAQDIALENEEATIEDKFGEVDNTTEDLQDQISNLQNRGRYLSNWNATTGLPTTNPTTELPYEYRQGDYFIVGTVEYNQYVVDRTYNTGDKVKHNGLYYECLEDGVSGIFDETKWDEIELVLYKPYGSSYTGVASSSVETTEIAVGDEYVYDGNEWVFQKNAPINLDNYVKSNTIFIKDIDFEFNKNKQPTRNIIIKTYPISNEVVNKVEEGRVAIRLNYRMNRSKSKRKTDLPQNAYGFANSFYKKEMGVTSKLNANTVDMLEKGLIHISSSDIARNSNGDVYIAKKINMEDFVRDSVLRFVGVSITPQDWSADNKYLSSICIAEDLSVKSATSAQPSLAYCFAKTYNKTRKTSEDTISNFFFPYTKIGASVLNDGYDFEYQVPKVGSYDDSGSDTFTRVNPRKILNYGVFRKKGIVFNTSFLLGSTQTQTELGLPIKSLYTNIQTSTWRLYRKKHKEIYNNGVNVLYPKNVAYGGIDTNCKIRRLKNALYSTFVPSFCVLKSDYANQPSYMYESRSPLFDKKVIVDIRPDYLVDTNAAKTQIIQINNDISFGVRVSIK